MDKKQQIIDIAIKLFATQGYENTPISTICEQSKVSKGLIFHHFKNKEGLLREVFVRMNEIINDTSEDASVNNDKISAKERLTHFLEYIFVSMTSAEHKLYYQFDFQVLSQPSLRLLLKDLIEQRYKLMMESFQSILNDIPAANSVVDSQMLIAEIDGIALNYLFAGNDYPLAEIKNRFINKYLLLLNL